MPIPRLRYSAARTVRLYRRLLQSCADPLRHRQYHPTAGRGQSRVTRCPLFRGKVSGRADAREPAAEKKHDRGWGGRRMRYSATEKLEIIHLVEQSPLPARHTLAKLGIARATLYRWYDRYSRGGPEALNDRSPRP